MPIQWFAPNTAIPTITIAVYGINFNSGALAYLKDVSSVMLGCDVQEKKMYIKLLKNSETNGFNIPAFTKDTKNIRISCREFVQFLQVKLKLDLSRASKYVIDIVSENEISVDLSSPVPLSKKQKNK